MKRIAIQGISGAFHEIAAREYFKNEEIEIVPCNTFKDVFSAIENDKTLLGIIAIENTIAGSLLQNHNLLRESECLIVGEQKLHIEHHLVALAGQQLEELEEVHSHPIALMQCEEFLESHKHLKAVESEDTALSAKEIVDYQIYKRAAICSLYAAQKYGLEIVERNIETNKKNSTRFLIVAEPTLALEMTRNDKINKASLVFALPHLEGSLSQVLSILSFYNMNLTKIQSLPIIGREWEYQFYIDLIFNDYSRYKQAIDAILPLIDEFQILGEYHVDI